MGTMIAYDKPREKLQRKGALALTTVELLQILIGSGNAQVKVAKIAKRAARLLAQHGSAITHDQLSRVIGLGPVRSMQIVAAFELAGRYPMAAQQLVLDSEEKVLSLVSDVASGKIEKIAYITVDGARRLISKRTVSVDTNHPTALLRKIFADVMTDNANGLIVTVGSFDRQLEPTMFDLSFARDLNSMSQLFMVTIHERLIVNQSRSISFGRL